jgi:hypothetical protein
MTETGVWITDDIDVSHLAPAQRSALTHWRAARVSPDEVPCRNAIDPPLALPAVLPVMIMFEVGRPSGPEAPERSYRYRLIGTELVNRAGRDLTGQMLDEVFGADAIKSDLEIYRGIEDRRCPYFGSRVSMIPNRQIFETYRRLLMPLRATKTDRIDRIWCVLDFSVA